MEPFSGTRLGPQTDLSLEGVADWIRTREKLLIGVFPVSNWEILTQEREEISNSGILE